MTGTIIAAVVSVFTVPVLVSIAVKAVTGATIAHYWRKLLHGRDVHRNVHRHGEHHPHRINGYTHEEIHRND